jgi:hypothetical protein
MAGRELDASFMDSLVAPQFAVCLRGRDALGTAGKMPALQNLVGRWWQAGDANSGVAFVPDVKSDQ